MDGIPRNQDESKTLGDKFSVAGVSPYLYSPHKSGSKITLPQFLTFRCIWPKLERPSCLETYALNNELVSKTCLSMAIEALAVNPEWATYAKSFSPEAPTIMENFLKSLAKSPLKGHGSKMFAKKASNQVLSGTFSFVRDFQLETAYPTGLMMKFDPGDATETNAMEIDSIDELADNQIPVEDEQEVNVALILFLNALTRDLNQSIGKWKIGRFPFLVPKLGVPVSHDSKLF